MADETPKIPANDNPWYVLATFHGEQQGVDRRDIDKDLHEKNRLFWNCWMAADLPEEEQQRLLDKGWVTREGLDDVGEKGRDVLWANGRRGDLPSPDPDDGINFNNTEFGGLLVLIGMFFPRYADFQDAEFQGYAVFQDSRFWGYAVFQDAEFQENAYFQDAEFQAGVSFQDAKFQGGAMFQDAEFKVIAGFENAEFQGIAGFVSAEFQAIASFQEAEFLDIASFQEAEFYVIADFKDTEFQGQVVFQDAVIRGRANFQNSEFQKDANFRGFKCQGVDEESSFKFKFPISYKDHDASGAMSLLPNYRSSFVKGEVNCQGAVFRYRADFFKSIFLGPVNFSDGCDRVARFLGPAEFGKAEFTGKVDFRAVEFVGPVSFKGVANVDGRIRARQFGGEVKFDRASFGDDVSFVNREFLDETSFRSARFLRKAPEFADSTLHEGTIWHGVQWPRTPSDSDRARDMADAYSHLRRRSNAIQDHEAELDFFGRELRAKRAWKGGATGLLITFYEWSCGFGQSVHLPVFWLLGLWAGLPPIYHLVMHHAGMAGIDPVQLYGFSAASLGGFFGVRKEFFADFMGKLPDAALALSGMQSVLGAVFVFLLGLSLRNRFRIK